MSTTQTKKPSEAEQTVETFIEAMRQGNAPWQRTWKPDENVLPHNPTSGNNYKSINALILLNEQSKNGYTDSRWMTEKQAVNAGAQIKSNEKGTFVVRWQFDKQQAKLNDQGKPIFDSGSKLVKETVKLECPEAFWSIVFNAAQIDGLPEIEKEIWNPIERAKQIIEATDVKTGVKLDGKAGYDILTDTVFLKNMGYLSDENEHSYLQGTLRNLVQATGHDSRLNRDLSHPTGSEGRAKEELITEIGNVLICLEARVGFEPNKNNIAYVESWVKNLQDTPTAIFQAATQGEKAKTYLTSKALEQEQTQDQNFGQEQGQVTTERNYIDVPYLEKDEAKNLGAKWDKEVGAWYVPEDVPIENFEKWTTPSTGYVKEATTETGVNEMTQVEEQVVTFTEKTYIAVPFGDRNEAKQAGALWDKQAKSWFAPEGAPVANFEKWEKAEHQDKTQGESLPDKSVTTREYLDVPYDSRDYAKEAGALWDSVEKSWYKGPNADHAALDIFKPNENARQENVSPREEFTEELRAMGFNVTGDHPIMDGEKHRIDLIGEQSGKHTGFYTGYLDGVPNGYAMNNKTGEEVRWKQKGYVCTSEDKKRLEALAEHKNATREKQTMDKQNKASERSQQVLKDYYKPATEATSQIPYLAAKGIQATKGTFVHLTEGTLAVPMRDTAHKHWSTQYISAEDNSKSFAKGGKLEGCLHLIGDEPLSVAKTDTIIIAEGYSTAASIAEAVSGVTVIVAFNGNNLKHVATSIRETFPEKNIVIAADNDKELIINNEKRNIGVEKATEAAEAVNATVVIPQFNAKDDKMLTDFNDLATKSKTKEGVFKQITVAINRCKREAEKKHQESQQTEKKQKQAQGKGR